MQNARAFFYAELQKKAIFLRILTFFALHASIIDRLAGSRFCKTRTVASGILPTNPDVGR